MKQKNKLILKDILWFLLFGILIGIPGIILLIHPIVISTYYNQPLWLFLYLAFPAEMYAFVIYFAIVINLIFK